MKPILVSKETLAAMKAAEKLAIETGANAQTAMIAIYWKSLSPVVTTTTKPN